MASQYKKGYADKLTNTGMSARVYYNNNSQTKKEPPLGKVAVT